MSDDLSHLTPANENPWYVLMTLHGEQPTQRFNWDRHSKNVLAWNSFVWHRLTVTEKANLSQEDFRFFDVEHIISEDELRSLFAERVPKKLDLNFPNPLDGLSFSHVYFQKLFSTNDFFVPWKFSIHKCVFTSRVAIENSYFSDRLTVSKTSFESRLSVEKTKFVDRLIVSNSEFKGAFSAAYARMELVDFKRCKFFEKVDFYHTEFAKLFKTSGSTFFKEVSFFESYFQSGGEIDTATFKEHVDFGGAIFDREKFEFLNVEGFQTGIDFYQAKFHSSLSFQFAEFLFSYPDFQNTVIPEHTVFTVRKNDWPKSTEQDAETAKNSCATIRNCFAKQGLPEEEHFFFRREMRFAGQIGSIWQRLPYRLYGLVSNYGYSIARPVLWLAALIVTCFLIYQFAFNWGEFRGGIVRQWYEPLVLSFSNTFKIFGFQGLFFESEYFTKLSAWVKFVSGVQTILGFVLLFFLGLGLRQRFRLR